MHTEILATRRGTPTIENAPTLDHREAKAQALAVLAGADPLIATRDALDTLTQRNKELLDGGADAIREALADQISLLEAVVIRYTLDAAKARNTDQRRALASMSMRASTVLTGALLTLHRITEDTRNAQAIPSTACEVTY